MRRESGSSGSTSCGQRADPADAAALAQHADQLVALGQHVEEIAGDPGRLGRGHVGRPFAVAPRQIERRHLAAGAGHDHPAARRSPGRRRCPRWRRSPASGVAAARSRSTAAGPIAATAPRPRPRHRRRHDPVGRGGRRAAQDARLLEQARHAARRSRRWRRPGRKSGCRRSAPAPCRRSRSAPRGSAPAAGAARFRPPLAGVEREHHAVAGGDVYPAVGDRRRSAATAGRRARRHPARSATAACRPPAASTARDLALGVDRDHAAVGDHRSGEQHASRHRRPAPMLVRHAITIVSAASRWLHGVGGAAAGLRPVRVALRRRQGDVQRGDAADRR